MKNRNKIKPKKSNTVFYIIMAFLFILIDTIIVLNYSNLKLMSPNMSIMDRLLKLSEVLATKEAINLRLTGDLKAEFINTQKVLAIPYAIMCMMLLSNMLKPKSDFKNMEHGSAEWASKEEIKRLNQPKKSFVLGKKLYLDPLDENNENANELLIGGSGKGKSFRKVKPDILQMVGSYIITDPKGELHRDTAKVLKKNGYKVKVLNIDNPKYSNGYNPFKYIRMDNLESDVLVLVNVFMKNTKDEKSQGGDQFWDDSIKALLTSIIFYLMLEKEEERTFERVFELTRNVVVDEETGDIDPNRSELERIYATIEKNNPYHPGLQAYQEFKLASGKTAKSILISLAVRMNIWINKDVCTMTYEDELELEKVGVEKTAIFLITPDTDDTFNVLASMFYTQAFRTLFYEADFNYSGALPNMVSCELDEFANIGQIPNFEKIIATCRSRNVRLMPVIQGISQLEKLYKDTWETIVACCNTINYIGGNDSKTHKYISDRLDKTTVFIQTRGESKSSKSASFSENGNYISRNLLTPGEVGKLKNKNSIIFISGMNPIFAEKYNTKKHPLIKDVGGKYSKHNNTDIKREYEKIAQERGEKFELRRKEKLEKLMKFKASITEETEEDIKNEFEKLYD